MEHKVYYYLSEMLLLLCYHDVLTIYSLLSMKNQVLFHSLSVVN